MDTGDSPAEGPSERPRNSASSWAFSVNETARHGDVEITLLTCTVVDDLVRITGLFRLGGLDARLGSIPRLDVMRGDGVALTPVSAHVLPHGGLAWVSWLFERPATVLTEYTARIDSVSVVDYEFLRRPPAEHPGPWAFRFELPPGPADARMLSAISG